MFRAAVQIDDKEYKFEDEEHVRMSIVIHREPTTKEMVKGICYYQGNLDSDINEYKLSDNKDEIEVVIDFE